MSYLIKIMAFSKSSLWIHIIFSTKNRIPYLSWDVRNDVCSWLKEEAFKNEILIDIVNGVDDHLHVLVKLKNKQSVSEVVKWIKGSSSYYLNKKYNWEPKFSWQNGYAVYSVSENNINETRRYIFNQEKRHSRN